MLSRIEAYAKTKRAQLAETADEIEIAAWGINCGSRKPYRNNVLRPLMYWRLKPRLLPGAWRNDGEILREGLSPRWNVCPRSWTDRRHEEKHHSYWSVKRKPQTAHCSLLKGFNTILILASKR